MRTFMYCRCSTDGQDNENQVIAIKKARSEFENIPDSRIVKETISGSTQAMKRPLFCELVNSKLERGDMLVVLKLDRLGRDNIDVQQTIKLLEDRGIKITCLDLPVSDISSPEGRFMLQVFSAFAEFERGRIRERTREGLDKAKINGVVLGRPKGVSRHREAVQALKQTGLTQSMVSHRLNIGIATVKRHWNQTV
ncbi:recombinase family protein [Providencia stuartii]|uniref:Recombinase family protein n=2 Tax=Providencia TaxID=586 RepID=A0ABD5LBW6_PROST|nr:recombinase family protein [Providencia stuartii]MCX3072584.1 recombinase family protein [Providencia stuartii]MDT7048389.1 recombinase family protein [Providencia stuartii]